MNLFYYDKISKYRPLIRRMLNNTSYFLQVTPEMSVVVYFQSAAELHEENKDEFPCIPILEEFISLTVDGKIIYERFNEIENSNKEEFERQQELKQEMIKSHSRQLLIDLLDFYSKWENQYGFDSAEKATYLANTIKNLYEGIVQSVKCESIKDEQEIFKEDQEHITQARKEFEKILIKLGFSGIPYTQN